MSIKFHGVSNYGDPLTSDLLETSVHLFMQNGFVNIGAFTNVRIPVGAYPSGIGSHSSPQYKLRSSRDLRYVSGRVWESARSDWVWESGIEYDNQPIAISGVYINDVFIPKNTVGASGFIINYPEGKIIFNQAISISSNVKCEYSHRNVRILSSDIPWFQTIQYDSFRSDDNQFQLKGSGGWDVLANNRIQLPAIVLETIPSVSLSPYELGSISRVHRQDMLMHVLAETPWDRKQIHDIIINQWQKRFSGVNKQKLLLEQKYPLTFDGQIAPSGLNYDQITNINNGYTWKLISWDRVRSQEQIASPPMYRSTIRTTFCIDAL